MVCTRFNSFVSGNENIDIEIQLLPIYSMNLKFPYGKLYPVEECKTLVWVIRQCTTHAPNLNINWAGETKGVVSYTTIVYSR